MCRKERFTLKQVLVLHFNFHGFGDILLRKIRMLIKRQNMSEEFQVRRGISVMANPRELE